MKKLIMILVIPVAVFAVVILIAFNVVQLDIFLNPWLKQAAQEWKWYNYFTSHHAFTVLYINWRYLWLVICLLPSLFIVFLQIIDE